MPISRFWFFALLMPALAGGAQSSAWQMQPSGVTAGLRGVHAVNSTIVWASGTDGTVLRSVNGGALWQRCSTPPDAAHLDFRAVWAWDAETALVLSSGPGDLSRLYETTCTSWRLVYTNPDAQKGFWDGLLFLNKQTGFVYGDPVPVATRKEGEEIPLLSTHDGGETWSRVAHNLSSLPGESFFAASNSAMTAQDGQIWLGTSKARVYTSRDGVNWRGAQTPLPSGNASSGVFSLAFRDRAHGVAVGGDYGKPDDATDTAAYTSDGGVHWTAAGKQPHGYRSAVAWYAAKQAWISAGTNGSDVSYDDGKTWQWLDSGNWNAISLPWAVGPRGQIGKLGTSAVLPAAGKDVSR